MEPAVITTRIPKHVKTLTKAVNPRYLDDAYFISLTEQINEGFKPSVSFDDVTKALASGSVSPAVIEDLEDTMFGAIMEESLNNESDSESVSFEEIMKILDE